MAKIVKSDLMALSDKEIKSFFVSENTSTLPIKIKQYIESGNKDFTMGNKINRVENLLKEIIIDRFLLQDY